MTSLNPLDQSCPPVVAEAITSPIMALFGSAHATRWRSTAAIAQGRSFLTFRALGEAFATWLAFIEDEAAFLEEFAKLGLSVVHVDNGMGVLTLRTAAAFSDPDLAFIPASPAEAVVRALILTEVADEIRAIRLREDSDGGGALEIDYDRGGVIVTAVYGEPRAATHLMIVREIGGDAVRVINRAIGDEVDRLEPEREAGEQSAPAESVGG